MAFNPAYYTPMAVPLPSDDNNFLANYQFRQNEKMKWEQSKALMQQEWDNQQKLLDKEKYTRRWSVPCEVGFDSCKKSLEVEIVAPFKGDSVLTVSNDGRYLKVFKDHTFCAHFFVCDAHAKDLKDGFDPDGVKDDTTWFGYETYLFYAFTYSKGGNYSNYDFLKSCDKAFAECVHGATKLN